MSMNTVSQPFQFENGRALENEVVEISRPLVPLLDGTSPIREGIFTFKEKAQPVSLFSQDAGLSNGKIETMRAVAKTKSVSQGPSAGFLSRSVATLFDLGISAGVGFGIANSTPAAFFDFLPGLVAPALEATIATAYAFYVLSSMILLMATGRTGGMLVTGIRAQHHGSNTIPFGSAFVRAFFFMPVAATLIGLVFGLFDGQGRCLHDRLSQTKVVPASTPESAARPRKAPAHRGLGLADI